MDETTDRKILGLISLGCPKNTVDSERLLGELSDLGWEFTDDINEAGCLVVNTCGFIEDAILESEEAIEEICSMREDRPDVLLVATGCLPQRSRVDIKKRFPELDLIVGVGDLEKLPGLIESAWNTRSEGKKATVVQVKPASATLSYADDPRLRLTAPWTAYVKIAEGCGHSCTFCTIPSIKGPYVSRPVDDILEEARILASEGTREIILISQDTTGYGSDIGTNLKSLLARLDKTALAEGIDWIRLHYLYPSKISDGLLETIASSERILPYFDIPLQHVGPEILKRMNRLAPDQDLGDLVRKIRKHFLGSANPACIRTTFIVGFPGETEDEIAMLEDFIEDVRLDRLTVFKFSPEEGTPAAELPDQVPGPLAESRYHNLMEAQHQISLEINEGFTGSTIEVLLEGETDDGRKVGRSYRDAPEIDGLVLVEDVADSAGYGDIVRVEITGALPYDLEGRQVSE